MKQVLGIILFSSLLGTVCMAQSFKIPVNSSVQYSSVGNPGGLQLGIVTTASVPVSSLFESEKGYEFRYDLPIGLGIEAAYGLDSAWELGLSLGYESFTTKNTPFATDLNKNQRVSLSSFPIMAHGRYVFYRSRLRMDLDLGLGVGINSVTVSERNSISNAEDSESTTRVLAQTLVSLGLPWADGFSVYFQAGPRFDFGSATRFPLVGGNGAVNAKAMNIGLLARAAVKYEF